MRKVAAAASNAFEATFYICSLLLWLSVLIFSLASKMEETFQAAGVYSALKKKKINKLEKHELVIVLM